MSKITRLRVQNFRSHDDYSFDLSPRTTTITGHNGSGKTSLIEAIYVSLQGSSFRGSDKDIIQHNTDWYRIDCTFDDHMRTVKFDSTKPSGKKQFIIDETKSYRMPPQKRFPVVLFEPEDLRLLSGSPARRRLFIDHLISQIDPHYHTAVRKYDRALKQRNNLLKSKNYNSDELFVWNVTLGEYGSYITTERIAFIERLNQRINETYNMIAQTNDQISIHYSYTLVDDVKAKIIRDLTLSFQKDTYLGYTTIGPHRDDVIFHYNNMPASAVASRGENRTVTLALKYLEADIITESINKKPIILLDDVYSELDQERQERLNSWNNTYQMVITHTQDNTSLPGTSTIKLI